MEITKDTIASTIDILENELECVRTAAANKCDRNCSVCHLVRDDEEIINGYNTALFLLHREA